MTDWALMSEKRERLNMAERQLQVLRDFTASLAEASSMGELLQTLANCTKSILDWDDCVIYLIASPGRLVQRCAYGAKSPDGTHIVDPIELDFGVGIAGAAAAAAQSQRVDDTRLDDRYVVDDQSRLSELAVPIVCDGAVVGVIDSEHAKVGFFTSNDQRLIEDVARIAAVRVKAALTLEEVERDRAILEQLASSDDLTGLGNRQVFEEALRTSRGTIQVAVLDLDRFRFLNDRVGHDSGDRVLKQLANALQIRLQSSSSTICRLGGDEFGIVERESGAADFAARLQLVLDDLALTAWPVKGSPIELSAAIGMASGYGNDAWSAARDALLVAKGDGGGQLVCLEEQSVKATSLRQDRRWLEMISDAIENDRFFLVGQPVQSLTTLHGPPAYYEMLLRYRDPSGQIFTPDQFLDSAHRFGMLGRIDGWVIRTAVEWLGANPAQSISVNVTPNSMINGFALDRTRQALVDFTVEASRVTLEVTEHAAIEDPHAFRRAVEAAREIGIHVAIDDLGSGWSSLAVIRDTRVDIVKIDGQWVRNAVTDPVARSAVRSMVDCAHLLDASVVAEWIEDVETLELMQEMGVEHGQGWLFSSALSLDEIAGESRSTGLAA